MRKKAITGLSSLVVLILILLTAFILFSFTDLWAKTLQTQHKNEISLWVSTTAAKLSIAPGGIGQATGSPPVTSLYEKPIEINKEEDFQRDANRIIAQAMLNCWQSFGSGEIAFLGNDYDPPKLGLSFNPGKTFCFPCAQIKISNEIKSKYKDLEFNKFKEFLGQPIAKNGPTYNELFKGQPTLDTQLNQNEDLYIIFIASKGTYTNILTKANFAITAIAFPGNRFFESGLILGNPETTSKMCNP